MTGPGDPLHRFLPAGPGAPLDLDAALRAGPAALAQALRALRAEIGAARTAARMRGLAERPGASLRLLLVAPIQPKSLTDALDVGFAIAGFALVLEAVEGFAALKTVEGPFDLVLAVDPSAAAEPDPSLVRLLGGAAARCAAPAALARLSAPVAETALTSGLDLLSVGVAIEGALDRRFGASFGTILKPAAADALADAAAAWAARRTGRAPKLLLTDLDGTLWDGTLGERAAEPPGEAAFPPVHLSYAKALEALSGRGIVLAVASRNEPGDVEAALAAGAGLPLGRGSFAAVVAGWDDKAALVARALAELRLGAEHTVFVDDDPVNCAKVAARFPSMDVRLFTRNGEAFAAALLADPLLLGGGAEGAERAERYRARARVERLRAETPDVSAFLAALDTRLTLLPLGAGEMRRAAELASRVNQFLLRDWRPNALALAARRSPFDTLVRLDDAFGSHGIVGLMLAHAEGETLVLDNLYLSCRALERGVEEAMLAALSERGRAAGLPRLIGRLEALPRNAPARRFVARVARLAEDGAFDYPADDVRRSADGGGPHVDWLDAASAPPDEGGALDAAGADAGLRGDESGL